MTEVIFMVEEAAEGGYTARALGEFIFTEADDLAQLQHVRDTVRCHFEDQTAISCAMTASPTATTSSSSPTCFSSRWRTSARSRR
jgi:hypothetical protein